MPVIALMTDFGIKDGTVGVMKGVIWGICPTAQISDVSHMIQAQNILEGDYHLARFAPYFPKGTIHVVVVDPGVGTQRRPMAAQIGDWFYVGPDNGTVTSLLERAEVSGWTCEFVELSQPKYWLQNVSNTFHGRDIFSPVAAHLANGVPLHEVGTPFTDPVRINLPKPTRISNGWRGEVIHIDHFGNVATNIRIENLDRVVHIKDQVTVLFKGKKIFGLVNTFGERPPGDLIALMGSTGNLGISVVNGNAAAGLGVKVGDVVEVLIP